MNNRFILLIVSTCTLFLIQANPWPEDLDHGSKISQEIIRTYVADYNALKELNPEQSNTIITKIGTIEANITDDGWVTFKTTILASLDEINQKNSSNTIRGQIIEKFKIINNPHYIINLDNYTKAQCAKMSEDFNAKIVCITTFKNEN